MAYLDTQPALGYGLIAGLGLTVGSFLNVVILRLPRRMEWEWRRDAREALELPEIYDPAPPGIAVEPSHCPHCKARLRWFENIPLLSWIALRGKCRHCGAPISIQYPFVELLTLVLSLACVWRFGFGWQGWGALIFSWFLIALSGIDIRTQLLPDKLTLPLLWLGLIASADHLYISSKASIFGAVLGYVSLWLVWWVFKQLTGKHGMGHGDFKLLAAIGAWCGSKALLPTLLISSVLGAVIGAILLAVQGRDKATPLPFGQYLALAGWIVFMWGGEIMDAYLRVTGLRP